MHKMLNLFNIFGLLLTYYLLTICNILPSPPFADVDKIIKFIFSGIFLNIIIFDGTTTVFYAILSWLSALIFSLSIGIFLSLNQKKLSFYIGVIEFLRAVPSAMWIPFAIVLIGLGYNTVYLVTSFVVFLYITSEIIYSDDVFNAERIFFYKRLGLNFFERVKYIHIYEILLVVIRSSKLALTIALVVIIIGEMQSGTQNGLGSKLVIYQFAQRGEAIVSIILLSGFIGITFNNLVEKIKIYLIRW